jgi:hypothetical protein
MKSSVKLFAMFIGLSMFALPTFTQDTPPVQPSELRSVVRLLPGYTSQAQDGVDTATEQISNLNGFKFTFIWDMYSGGVDSSIGKQKVRWRGEQIINGEKAIFVYTESDLLLVIFPENMVRFGGTVRRNQDLAEMLFMIATYGQKGGYAATPGSTILPKVLRRKAQP